MAQPTSIGSSMRRRASANVQKMSADPDDDQDEDQDVDGRVERVVVDAEDAESQHGDPGSVPVRSGTAVRKRSRARRTPGRQRDADGDDPMSRRSRAPGRSPNPLDARAATAPRCEPARPVRAMTRSEVRCARSAFTARPDRAGRAHAPSVPRSAEQVGHEVDRAGRQHGAVGARQRAGARDRAPRIGRLDRPAGTPPSCPASEASVAGGSARGFARAREHRAARACGSSARSIAAASLSSRTETTATGRRRRARRAARRPAPPPRSGCARRRGS